jgi:lysophospholipase L1-like esterase
VFSKYRILVMSFVLAGYILGILTVKLELFPYPQFIVLKKLLQDNDDLVSPPSYIDQAHYEHRKMLFEIDTGIDFDIVFVGDSITERAEWQELITNKRVANRGINGDRTTGVLNRIDSIISTSAEKAFLMVGINDLLAGDNVDAIWARYKDIIDQLKGAGMEVFIQSTLYTGFSRPELNQRIEILNSKLEHYANELDSVSFIDMNSLLAPNKLLERQYTEDKIHLNGLAYRKWISTISKRL